MILHQEPPDHRCVPGFNNGDASSPLTNGSKLATNQNKVVVSMNYRLGILGFYPMKYSDGTNGGLNGIRDQQAALQFVHDHIRSFGGNPNSVTVFGESAGGVSACIHAVSPASHGLLNRVIMESGGCEVSGPGAWSAVAPGSCTGSSCVGAVSDPELLAMAPQDVMALGDTLNATGSSALGTPLADGHVLPAFGTHRAPSGLDYLNAGQGINIEAIVVGVNSMDGTLAFNAALVSELNGPSYSAYNTTAFSEAFALAFSFLGSNAHKIFPLVKDYYDLSNYGGNIYAAVYSAYGDWQMACMNRAAAIAFHKQNISTYLYLMEYFWAGDISHYLTQELIGNRPNLTTGNYTNDGTMLGGQWASHTSEVGLVFGNAFGYYWTGNLAAESVEWNQDTAALSNAMQDAWGIFSATGDPNSATLTATWEQMSFRNSTDGALDVTAYHFGRSQVFEAGYHDDACNTWARLGLLRL